METFPFTPSPARMLRPHHLQAAGGWGRDGAGGGQREDPQGLQALTTACALLQHPSHHRPSLPPKKTEGEGGWEAGGRAISQPGGFQGLSTGAGSRAATNPQSESWEAFQHLSMPP